MKEQLATFLNSDYLVEEANTTFSNAEIAAMKEELEQFDDQELTQTLSYTDSVLENEFPEYATVKQQVVKADVSRSGAVEIASIAEFLMIIRENLDTVAILVLFARFLGDNKLQIGKFKYQGKSVLPSVSELFRQKNAK